MVASRSPDRLRRPAIGTLGTLVPPLDPPSTPEATQSPVSLTTTWGALALVPNGHPSWPLPFCLGTGHGPRVSPQRTGHSWSLEVLSGPYVRLLPWAFVTFYGGLACDDLPWFLLKGRRVKPP